MSRLEMINMVSLFPFAAAGTALTAQSTDNGWIKKMIVQVPNFTNNVTATITIVDPENLTVFTSSALARNTTTAIGDLITAAAAGEIPIGEHPWKVVCTLSGDAGGSGGVVKAVSYIKR